jgi:hypothetical protein
VGLLEQWISYEQRKITGRPKEGGTAGDLRPAPRAAFFGCLHYLVALAAMGGPSPRFPSDRFTNTVFDLVVQGAAFLTEKLRLVLCPVAETICENGVVARVPDLWVTWLCSRICEM